LLTMASSDDSTTLARWRALMSAGNGMDYLDHFCGTAAGSGDACNDGALARRDQRVASCAGRSPAMSSFVIFSSASIARFAPGRLRILKEPRRLLCFAIEPQTGADSWIDGPCCSRRCRLNSRTRLAF
jgi:hypothetical protein